MLSSRTATLLHTQHLLAPIVAQRTCRAPMSATASFSGGESVGDALQAVLARIRAAAASSGSQHQTRLVAVSKTKPAEAIQEAYDVGQRDFGENYVQELLDKAPLLPDDVRWHFIGHLQSNKVKALLGVPNLAMVETVDSIKLAERLDKAAAAAGRATPLGVMVQVNTSGEESKFGVEPEQCVEVAQAILQGCPNLRFVGLMTIGMPDYSSKPENFSCLVECRQKVAQALGLQLEEVELSMGMSGDYEQAVQMGSNNVRVGSSIFGARQYPPKA